MRLVPSTTINGVNSVTQVTVNGTLTGGQASITGIADTSVLAGALYCSGPGVASGALVVSIDSPTQVTLSGPATSSGTVGLTFVIEPLSLAEAKQHARVEFTDDDELIAGLIASSRLYCEAHLRSALLKQSWTLFLDSFPSAGGYYNRAIREIWPSLGGMPSGLGFYPGLVPNSTGVIDIPWPPLISIDSLEYDDFQGNVQSVPSDSYNVSLGTPARIQPQYSHVWPISRPTIDSVRINFTCGYGGTSASVPSNVRAAMKLMVAHWYENREWVGSGTTYTTVPNTVDALLSPSDPGIYV